MLIRTEGSNLPGNSCGPSPEVPEGYRNIHVGVQRKDRPGELLDMVCADAQSVIWTLETSAIRSQGGVDLKGQYISGPPGGRFVYLSWGTVDENQDFTMFRRAKLWLDAVPSQVIERATELGVLLGRLGMSDARGNPLCAAVQPPAIDWSAVPE